jgi:hypothetical protein
MIPVDNPSTAESTRPRHTASAIPTWLVCLSEARAVLQLEELAEEPSSSACNHACYPFRMRTLDIGQAWILLVTTLSSSLLQISHG